MPCLTASPIARAHRVTAASPRTVRRCSPNKCSMSAPNSSRISRGTAAAGAWTFVLPRPQEFLCPRVAYQGLEPSGFLPRHAFAAGGETEIPSPLIFGTVLRRHHFDQAVGEHPPQRAVEVARKNALAGEPFLNDAHEAPAVPRLLAQRQVGFRKRVV